jgi:hypothetical protein
MRTWGLVILVSALLSMPVAADTIMIIGVVVSKDGQRVPGANILLYATSSQLGKPLAQDRTSERGIFNLYRSNIAGDLGDLYVVYLGDAGDAAPLKVSLKAVQSGLIEARTGDVIVLPKATAALTPADAAERIAAITQTQSVLARAAAITQTQAEATIAARTNDVAAWIPSTPAATATVKKLTTFGVVQLADPKIDQHMLAIAHDTIDAQAVKRAARPE